ANGFFARALQNGSDDVDIQNMQKRLDQAQRQPPESAGGAQGRRPNHPRLANGKRGGCSLQRSLAHVMVVSPSRLSVRESCPRATDARASKPCMRDRESKERKGRTSTSSEALLEHRKQALR